MSITHQSFKKRIKNVALKMIKESGLINLSKCDLCKELGISEGSFNYFAGCTFTDFFNGLKNEIIAKHYPVTKNRVNAELRKEQILSVAVELYKKHGEKIIVDDIAFNAGVSRGLVLHHYSTMKQLKRAIKRAIKNDTRIN